jgi:TonB family protein
VNNRTMRLIKNLWIVCVLAAWLSGTSHAQCHASIEAANAGPDNVPASIASAAGRSGEEDRTIVVELALRKSGEVRNATVVKGPTIFREAAIKAVKKHNYKNQMDVWPFQGQITVEVKFPRDTGASPEIRQVLPAGVPSCIPAPTRVRISQAVMANRLLSRVEPVYPPEAQTEHIAGVVVVRLVIDKNGGVLNADYVSGPPVLVAAAIEAIKQWKYQPYLLNGVLVEVETTVEISFTQ